MATGAPGSNGVWVYGEDDSEATFSALLNKAASTTNTQLGLDRARLTTLEQAGRVVQVVYATQATQLNTTTAYPGVSTGLSVTITPRFANSQIIIVASQYVQPVSLSNSFDGGVAIFRNNTTDLAGNNLSANAGLGAGSTLAIRHLAHLMRSDFPNTTSAVSYNTRIWLSSGLRYEAQPSNQTSSIAVYEIKV